jgi:hypothetical protein
MQNSRTGSAAQTILQGLGNETISQIPQKTLLLEAGKAENSNNQCPKNSPSLCSLRDM